MDVSYMAFAATGFSVHADRAKGEEAASATDQVTKIDLGLKPAVGCHGPVIVPRSQLVFAAFAAEGGSGEGTALVELTGCSKWRLCGGALSSNEPVAIDTDSLDLCSTFEILKSSWARASGGTAELRHFVFTFFGLHPEIPNRGKNFECLAEGIHAELLPEADFGDVIEYIDVLDATA